MEDDFRFIKSILRSSPVYYGAIDLRDNKLIYSDDFNNLLSYSKEKMQKFASRSFEDIVHIEDLSKLRKARKELLKSKPGEVIKTIVRIKRSDGKYLDIQLNYAIYEWDTNGEPIKSSTVAEDITNEADLKKSLKEKLKIIDKVNYKNSHDLRGPVSSLMGLLELIDASSFKSEYHHEVFLCLKKTVQKLDTIIHEINEYTSPN